MTDAREYADGEGTFGERKDLPEVPCRKCGRTGCIVVRTWESDCGGYEDRRYECQSCGWYWWIDGPDA